jgi:predicted nuclease of predicted toxin-antitoxin system
MKILLDEGLPRRAVALLREQGTDAVHVTEIRDGGTADEAIVEEARAAGWIVVTLDADFHALLALHGWSSPSVIRIRREGLSASDVCDLVIRLIADHETSLVEGVALSVRGHLVGIRKLPLKPAESGPDDDAAG